MTTYIHELRDWPRFHWNVDALAGRLSAVRFRQGRLLGRMETLGFSLREEAVLQTLTSDILKSSEIEGKVLDKTQVRSSIARRLGMDIGALARADRSVEGVVEMMLDATQNYNKPLNKKRLLGWNAALFPAGYSGIKKIKTGAWRDDANGPMQVVSGRVGNERVHFEAPAASRIQREMTSFFEWLNRRDETDPILRAGIAHLWFVTIHPFEDGNGRIARAITDMVLARSENSPQRFYSMPPQIRDEQNGYYAILEKTQKGTLDITSWLDWFLACLDHAFDKAESALQTVLSKSLFWESHLHEPFNDRQRKILNKMLDGNFEGKLTSSKWARLVKCSQDTALRDILDLVNRGVLIKDSSGGRSTSYSLRA
ncbi:MAG: Fic family protein [Actinomycetota bacterium]|nr:Fic family protein [Actinomycetota bacterium]